MSTIMSWGNSEGEKGRCDAKCHEAVEPECRCMCGGRYHGSTRDGTLQHKLEEDGERIINAARERARREGMQLTDMREAKLLMLPLRFE